MKATEENFNAKTNRINLRAARRLPADSRGSASPRGDVGFAQFAHELTARPEPIYGPTLTLTTGSISHPVPKYTVLQSPLTGAPNGVLLQSTLFEPTVATDLSGNVIWSHPAALSILTRPQPGGSFFGIGEYFGQDPSHQIIREFDLAGVTLRETNAARINEQLAALGKRQINAFHHEARGLPDGGVLVLANTEQILNDVQGPGPVNVLGDMILVLDRDLQVLWAWDAFDYLDPSRLATLGEVCADAGSGCPPYLSHQSRERLAAR